MNTGSAEAEPEGRGSRAPGPAPAWRVFSARQKTVVREQRGTNPTAIAHRIEGAIADPIPLARDHEGDPAGSSEPGVVARGSDRTTESQIGLPGTQG